MGDTMRLTAEGITVNGEDELTADVRVSTAREVVMVLRVDNTAPFEDFAEGLRGIHRSRRRFAESTLHLSMRF